MPTEHSQMRVTEHKQNANWTQNEMPGHQGKCP